MNASADWREFSADRVHYEDMLSFVMEAAEQAGLPRNRQMRLQLGFEEAVINVISYAYGTEAQGKIWIKAHAEGEHFLLEIKDSGVQFNPLLKEDALAHKPSSLEEAKIGGLGIALMRRVFSDIRYDYAEENGSFYNHLCLRFESQ